MRAAVVRRLPFYLIPAEMIMVNARLMIKLMLMKVRLRSPEKYRKENVMRVEYSAKSRKVNIIRRYLNTSIPESYYYIQDYPQR
jgi:hypothetical protein